MKIKEKEDYIKRLVNKMFPAGRLLSGQINPTYNCNLKCQHCFIVREDKPELKFEEITRIIKEVYKARVLYLCFSGGEPFLREDFLDIYTYTRRKGFLVSIFTNGTLITPQIADYLAGLPPYSIEITLNGITEKVYQEISGVPGSFVKAMQAIQMLRERKLPLVIKANGMKINRDEILKIKKFSEELLGKKHFRCDLVLSAAMDGSKKPSHLRLSPEEILNIEYSDKEMRSLCKKQFLHHNKEEFWLKQGYLFPCDLASFQIDPYGQMRLCSFLKEEHANLKNEEFLKGFNRLYLKLRNLKFETPTKCHSCQITHLCRQCPGRALVETGDREAPVEFFCELAHKQLEKEEELLNKIRSL